MESLSQMLNNAGYKEHSDINPLVLQSKVLKIVKKWLQQKHLPVDPDQEEYHRFRINWNYVINKLLGELEHE